MQPDGGSGSGSRTLDREVPARQMVRQARFPGAPLPPPQPLGRRHETGAPGGGAGAGAGGGAGGSRPRPPGHSEMPQWTPRWTAGDGGSAAPRKTPTITLSKPQATSSQVASTSRPVTGQAKTGEKPARMRCMVDHLEANLAQQMMSDLVPNDVLPQRDEKHFCCVTDQHVAPLHASQHDPDGPDGVNEAVIAIIAKAGTFEEASRRIKADAAKAAASGEIFVDEEVVSLKCPMTAVRLTVPGKGKGCRHSTCFDLHTFIRVNIRTTRVSGRIQCNSPKDHPKCHPLHTKAKPRGMCDYCRSWRCPICMNPTRLGDLCYDPFTARILKDTMNSRAMRAKVTLSRAAWEPELDMKQEDDETSSEDGDGPHEDPAKAAAANHQSPIIILDDDSDEEEEGNRGAGVGAGNSGGDGGAGGSVSVSVSVRGPSPSEGALARAAEPTDQLGLISDQATRGQEGGFPIPSGVDNAGRPSTDPAEPPCERAAAGAATTGGEREQESRGGVGSGAERATPATATFTAPINENSEGGTPEAQALSPPINVDYGDGRRSGTPGAEVLRPPLDVNAPFNTNGGGDDGNVPKTVIPDSVVPHAHKLFVDMKKAMEPVMSVFEGPKTSSWIAEVMASAFGQPRAMLVSMETALLALHEHTLKQDVADVESVRAAVLEYQTGKHFQNFKKMVREKVVRGSPLEERLRRICLVMTITRNHWKSIIRSQPREPPLTHMTAGRDSAEVNGRANGGGVGPAQDRGGIKRKADDLPREGVEDRGKRLPRIVYDDDKGLDEVQTTTTDGVGKEELPRGSRGWGSLSALALRLGRNGAKEHPAKKGTPEGAAGAGPSQALNTSAEGRTKVTKEQSRRELVCFASGHGHCEWDGRVESLEATHPVFPVPMCQGCYKFYYKDEFLMDEDGSYMHCLCCGDGSNSMVMCDKCPWVFCTACIQQLAGSAYLDDLLRSPDDREWKCLSCDPAPVKAHIKLYGL